MDVIALSGIRAYGKHGATKEERAREQALDIDIELELDLAKPRASDDLRDTLDYALLHGHIVSIVKDRSFALLERLAGEILDALLSDHRVERATVSIAKPLLLGGATPRVVMRRARGGIPPS